MDLDPLLIASLLTLGACGGLLAGMLGIGGGMVLVPFTTVLLETHGFSHLMALKVAVATSLGSICFTSLSSVRAHHVQGNVRWPLVAAMAPGLVLGSLLGARVASLVPVRLLTLAFACFVGVMATQLLRRRSDPVSTRPPPGRWALAGVAAGIGVVSSWVGAGGAFMTVPYLLSRQVPMHHTVGTSAALGFPIALAGGLGYALADHGSEGLPPGMLGFVFVPALLCLSVASVLMAPVGAGLARRLDTRQLRRAFAVMLFGIAIYMLQRAVRG